MDISWYGQSFFKLKGKAASVMIDPFDPSFTGLKFPKDVTSQLILITHQHQDHNFIKGLEGDPLIIQGPGEYEKASITVNGIAAFHDNKKGEDKGQNTLYHILVDGINVVHLGDLGHILTDEQVSALDGVDILLIPVGGTYTINAEVAALVVAQLEPSIVIPMHYKIPELKIDLDAVEPFLKEMGADNVTASPKLSITRDKLPDETMVVVLSKS